MLSQEADVTCAVLLTEARQAAQHAYNPYSHFSVGAALMTNDGRIFTGCNVENASLGLTICAERVAAATAVAAGARKFVAMAVVGSSDSAVTPCGACRQFLAEFTPDGASVYCGTLQEDGPVTTTNLGKLLPDAFRSFIAK